MINKLIILFGPPGSGKGTQGQILSEKLDYDYVSIGTELARIAAEDTSISNEIKSYQASGQLVPDSIVNKVIIDLIDMARGAVILDGYPRTIEQAEFLRSKYPQADVISFYLEIPDNEVIKRISGRRICSKCEKIFLPPDSLKLEKCDECGGELIERKDDNIETAKKRLHLYHSYTEPLVKYYKSKKGLLEIDGQQSIQDVTVNILKYLN